MVPQDIEAIGPAIAKALEALDARLHSDRASVGRDRVAERSATGVAALDEVIQSVSVLKSKVQSTDPRSER